MGIHRLTVHVVLRIIPSLIVSQSGSIFGIQHLLQPRLIILLLSKLLLGFLHLPLLDLILLLQAFLSISSYSSVVIPVSLKYISFHLGILLTHCWLHHSVFCSLIIFISLTFELVFYHSCISFVLQISGRFKFMSLPPCFIDFLEHLVFLFLKNTYPVFYQSRFVISVHPFVLGIEQGSFCSSITLLEESNIWWLIINGFIVS